MRAEKEKEAVIMKKESHHALHGGDLDEISRIYGIDKNEILNFSGNVNPLGLSSSVKKAIAENTDKAVNYPDVSYVALRKAIAFYTGAKSSHIVVGNGSTELISLFIKTVSPRKAVIVSPAYSEYLREVEMSGGSAELFPLKEEDDFMLDMDRLISDITDSIDLLVICNPNNPTGTYMTCEQIRRLLIHCSKNNTYVMIDETYVEFSDKEISAVPLTGEFKNLFVVRGTSKFFACPGLRLGYGICSDENILSCINDRKDPWSVNIFAETGGQVMFTDSSFINSTKELISSERKRMYKELKKLEGIYVYDTQANFFLCRILKEDITSTQIFEELIKDNILIRDASDFPYLGNRYLRFCILDKKSNTLLLNSLKNCLK